MGVPIRHENLFENRFTRTFDPDHRPAYLVNPCELAPDSNDSGSDREVEVTVVEKVDPAIAEVVSADDTPICIVQKLVAQTAELPIETIRPGSRMLSDLHLNSIRVSQIVNQTAQFLKIAPTVPRQRFRQ